MEFTSFMCRAKWTMIRKLPEKFGTLIHEDTAAEVTWLLKELSALYSFISAWQPAKDDLALYQHRVKEWIKQFCALGDRR